MEYICARDGREDHPNYILFFTGCNSGSRKDSPTLLTKRSPVFFRGEVEEAGMRPNEYLNADF
jgi:hypothetical protein